MKKTFIAGMAALALIFAVVLGGCEDESPDAESEKTGSIITYTLRTNGDGSAVSTKIIVTFDKPVPGLALADIAFDFGATGSATNSAIVTSDDKTFDIGITTPAATGFVKVKPALEGYDFQTENENIRVFTTPFPLYGVKVKLTIDEAHLTQTFNTAMPADWGDGTSNNLAVHTYAKPGEYIVIRGPATDSGKQFERMYTDNDTPMEIIEISPSIKNADYMFHNCTGLTTAPDLSALSALTSASYMFYSCTGLTTAPDLSALSELKDASFMFRFCSEIIEAPDLSALTELTDAMGMFLGCTGLTTAPNLRTLSKLTNALGMFYYCSELTETPDLSGLTQLTNAKSMFDHCTKLTTAPDLSALTKLTEAGSMFEGCKNLYLGDDYTLPTQNCNWVKAFYVIDPMDSPDGSVNVTSLISKSMNLYCFTNNTALTNYADIPADWR